MRCRGGSSARRAAAGRDRRRASARAAPAVGSRPTARAWAARAAPARGRGRRAAPPRAPPRRGPLLGDRDLELAEPFARPGAQHLRLVAKQPLPLREGVPQDRVAHQHGVEEPEVVEPEVILAERPEAQPGWADDAVRLRGELPAHQAQQRRLPGPVRADQAVVAACTELPAHALVELLPAEGHPQVAERDHRASHAPRSERRRSMIAALGRRAKAGRGHALAARGPPSRRCQTGDR